MCVHTHTLHFELNLNLSLNITEYKEQEEDFSLIRKAMYHEILRQRRPNIIYTCTYIIYQIRPTTPLTGISCFARGFVVAATEG